MTDNPNFEFSKANDKQAFKSMLDSIKEQTMKKMFLDSPPVEESKLELQERTPETSAKPAEPPSPEQTEILCGKEAEIDQVANLSAESVSLKELNLPAGKKYFRIGEVSELVGVEPYVLRYWESEFAVIKPVKSGSGHRVYARRDVENLYQIRHLLHVEKFSIKGAKKKLQEHRKEAAQVKQAQAPGRQALRDLASDLKELIQIARQSSGY
jgi:DNA-binding transcriptional MerR regulator